MISTLCFQSYKTILNKLHKYSIVLIGVFISSTINNTFAQESTIEEVKKNFPEELAVYLKKSEHVNIDIIKDSVIVKSDNYSELLHLSDKSNIYAEKAIYESKFIEISNLEAKTLSPTKKDKYETIKVTHFIKKNELGNSIFYDDSKTISFVFPNIKQGAKTILSYQETIREPRFLGSYFFAEHLGVAESEYKVSFNSKIKIKYQLFGNDTKNIEFSEIKKGNKTTYIWKIKNIKGYRLESSSPNIRYYAPHVMIYIDEAEIKGNKIKYLSNVDELYNFFQSFVQNVNKKDDEIIKKTVDSLITGAKDDLEKTKRIFYWVQDNIKYIAFEDGYGGFIPREASNIFQKRYGDCKDMASIITYMLKYAKIPAYLTWIGSRHIPYTFDKNPSPSSANHMIATAFVDGKYIYLDATGLYTRFGFPTDMIQGKQCIMSISNNEFKKEFVPEIPKDKNPRYDSININIEGNTLYGKGIVKLDGYSKLDLVYPLNSKTGEKEKEILTSYLEKGNNKFFLDTYNINGLSDRDLPVNINYSFKVEDYAKTLNKEIYINLNLDKILKNGDLDLKTRQLAVERDYKFTDEFIVNLEIPKGYILSYLPQNSSYKHDLFSYTIDYQTTGNKITLKRKINIDVLLLEKQNFEAWNKMVSEINKCYKEVIVLKK